VAVRCVKHKLHLAREATPQPPVRERWKYRRVVKRATMIEDDDCAAGSEHGVDSIGELS
jgi:hypothetical protein